VCKCVGLQIGALEYLGVVRGGATARRDLIQGASSRLLVRPPPEEASAVPEAASRDVIVALLSDELWSQRLHCSRPVRAPAAGSSGRPSREAGRLDERLELPEHALALGRGKTRREPDVVQEAFRVIEPQQERSDHTRFRG